MVELGPLGPACPRCGRDEGHAGPCTTGHLEPRRCLLCGGQMHWLEDCCVNPHCTAFGRRYFGADPEPEPPSAGSQSATHPVALELTVAISGVVLIAAALIVGIYGLLRLFGG